MRITTRVSFEKLIHSNLLVHLIITFSHLKAVGTALAFYNSLILTHVLVN